MDPFLRIADGGVLGGGLEKEVLALRIDEKKR